MGNSVYIGEIRLFAFNYSPPSFMRCQGQRLPISDNEELFSIIGTMYGGDGRTDFALPDLEDSAPKNKLPLGPSSDFLKYYIAVTGVFPPRQ